MTRVMCKALFRALTDQSLTHFKKVHRIQAHTRAQNLVVFTTRARGKVHILFPVAPPPDPSAPKILNSEHATRFKPAPFCPYGSRVPTPKVQLFKERAPLDNTRHRGKRLRHVPAIAINNSVTVCQVPQRHAMRISSTDARIHTPAKTPSGNNHTRYTHDTSPFHRINPNSAMIGASSEILIGQVTNVLVQLKIAPKPFNSRPRNTMLF